MKSSHIVNTLTIRAAITQDWEPIVSIRIEGWKESYKGIIDQTYLDAMVYTDESVSRRREFFRSNKSMKCLVAELGDKIIGFVDLGPSREPDLGKGEIYAIYLLDEYKRRGIGGALWRAAIECLQNQKLTPFIVWGLRDNLPARRFYEKMGGTLLAKKESDIGGRLYPEVCYQFQES